MSAATTFARPHEDTSGIWNLRALDGRAFPLRVDRWYADAAPEEAPILARAVDAAIDIGCGPGRHVVALKERGIRALGIDAAPAAVSAARARGARAVSRSVFSPIPGSRRWGSALLLDGNIGIGGDPIVLLQRTKSLLRPGGVVLVEVEPPGTVSERLLVRLEKEGAERHGLWFRWAILGSDRLPSLADEVGLQVADLFESGGRWFAELRTP